MECPNCKKELANNAKVCPNCGYEFTDKKKNVINICLGLIFFVVIIIYIMNIMSNNHVVNSAIIESGNDYVEQINNKVAQDAVAQYNIAKRQGDKTQICVQAGIVAAAYLQAQDETNYQQWKSTQSTDCKAAGMPY